MESHSQFSPAAKPSVALRRDPGSSRGFTPGGHPFPPPEHPTPFALSSCPTGPDYTSQDAPLQRGGALQTWGGWARHVPPPSANAEPRGWVTCRCLALLCAPRSVGAQSVARRLGASRWVLAWRRLRRRRARDRPGRRRAASGRRWRGRGPETWRAGGRGAFVFCVRLGRSLGFCPCSPGTRLGEEGARPAVGFSPGCERGDNRGLGRPPASMVRWARLLRGPHCLMESEAAGARAPEGRRPPGLPGLRGGGRGQLGGLELGVEAVRRSPLQPPQGCGAARYFWRELGGGGAGDGSALPAREGRGRPGGPLAPPIPLLPTRAGSRVWRGSRRFEKARGAEGRGQGPERRAGSDWPGPPACPPGPGPRPCWVGCCVGCSAPAKRFFPLPRISRSSLGSLSYTSGLKRVVIFLKKNNRQVLKIFFAT